MANNVMGTLSGTERIFQICAQSIRSPPLGRRLDLRLQHHWRRAGDSAVFAHAPEVHDHEDHFRGGEGSHGSMFHRAPGSIGASSYPSRVVPGMRMGGHLGNAQITVRNLEVIEVDTEDNVLVVKGAVPGPNGGYVLVRRSKR